MAASISGYMCNRWAVKPGVRLSIATWLDEGFTHYAVALMDQGRGGWRVRQETAQEQITPAGESDGAAYWSTVYGAELVKQELGECPDRFFKDNYLSRKGAR